MTGPAGSGFAEDTEDSTEVHHYLPIQTNYFTVPVCSVLEWKGQSIPLVINKSKLEEIQLKNKYSNDEMNKLISCMTTTSEH